MERETKNALTQYFVGFAFGTVFGAAIASFFWSLAWGSHGVL